MPGYDTEYRFSGFEDSGFDTVDYTSCVFDEDSDIPTLIKRREALKQSHEEYLAVDKAIRNFIKKKCIDISSTPDSCRKFIFDSGDIDVMVATRTNCIVPEYIKRQYAKVGFVFNTRIKLKEHDAKSSDSND